MAYSLKHFQKAYHPTNIDHRIPHQIAEETLEVLLYMIVKDDVAVDYGYIHRRYPPQLVRQKKLHIHLANKTR